MAEKITTEKKDLKKATAKKPVAVKKAPAKKPVAKKTAAVKKPAVKKAPVKAAVSQKSATKPAPQKTTTTKKTLSVTLVKRSYGRLPAHRATVTGLGLKRINHTVSLIDTPAVRGMINKVAYLLKVKD